MSVEKDLAELRDRLIDHYREIVRLSQLLRESIKADAGRCEVLRDDRVSLSAQSDRDYAAVVITQNEYLYEQQNPDQTICAPGVVAVSDESLDLARHLCAIKGKRFKTLQCDLREAVPAGVKLSYLTASWMKEAGMGGIHRRQANRQVKVFVSPAPERIQFGWHQVPRVSKLSAEEAISFLRNHSNSDEEFLRHKGIIKDHRSEVFARVVKSATRHPRANVLFASGYRMFTTSLPVLVSNRDAWPDVSLPETGISETAEIPKRGRLKERTKQVPLIPSHQIFAYKQEPEKCQIARLTS